MVRTLTESLFHDSVLHFHNGHMYRENMCSSPKNILFRKESIYGHKDDCVIHRPQLRLCCAWCAGGGIPQEEPFDTFAKIQEHVNVHMDGTYGNFPDEPRGMNPEWLLYELFPWLLGTNE